MDATAFRYITDVLTREEALAMLKAREGGKREREAYVKEVGYVQAPLSRRLIGNNMRIMIRYPAYITSAGWLGENEIDYCVDLELIIPVRYVPGSIDQAIPMKRLHIL